MAHLNLHHLLTNINFKVNIIQKNMFLVLISGYTYNRWKGSKADGFFKGLIGFILYS